jgi:ATP-binding dynein motor region
MLTVSFLYLEEQNTELIYQQNKYKILLKSLEDDLLIRMSLASDNINNDSALIKNVKCHVPLK